MPPNIRKSKYPVVLLPKMNHSSVPSHFVETLKFFDESWRGVSDVASVAFEQLPITLPNLFLFVLYDCALLLRSTCNHKSVVRVGFGDQSCLMTCDDTRKFGHFQRPITGIMSTFPSLFFSLLPFKAGLFRQSQIRIHTARYELPIDHIPAKHQNFSFSAVPGIVSMDFWGNG